MIRVYCDWCFAQVEDEKALQLVPFMSSGHCGEKVCPSCERVFTQHYEMARNLQMGIRKAGPYR